MPPTRAHGVPSEALFFQILTDLSPRILNVQFVTAERETHVHDIAFGPTGSDVFGGITNQSNKGPRELIPRGGTHNKGRVLNTNNLLERECLG